MGQQPLFNHGRLVDYLDERRTRAKQAARELPEARLREMLQRRLKTEPLRGAIVIHAPA